MKGHECTGWQVSAGPSDRSYADCFWGQHVSQGGVGGRSFGPDEFAIALDCTHAAMLLVVQR